MQKKQESLEQWAAMWSHVNEQAEEDLNSLSQDVGDDSQVSTSSTAQLADVTEFKHVAAGGLLSGIADELKKVEKDVRGVLDIIQNIPQEKLLSSIDAKLVGLSSIVSCTPKKVI